MIKLRKTVCAIALGVATLAPMMSTTVSCDSCGVATTSDIKLG